MFLLWWDTTKCLQLILEHGRVQTPLESVQFLNKHHLFGGCFVLLHLCIPLLLTLPSQLMHFVHRLPAPHLQRLRSRRWSEALWHARWRAHSGHLLPSLRSSHLDDWRSRARHPSTVHHLLCCLWCEGSELNADNMSSSVYLTLPVKVLARS